MQTPIILCSQVKARTGNNARSSQLHGTLPQLRAKASSTMQITNIGRLVGRQILVQAERGQGKLDLIIRHSMQLLDDWRLAGRLSGRDLSFAASVRTVVRPMQEPIGQSEI